MKNIRLLFPTAFVLASLAAASAQEAPIADDKAAAYSKVITERADKIVASLGLTEPAKATRVRDVIARQYRDLSGIHDARDTQVEAAKEKPDSDKATTDAAIKAAQDEARARLDRLHGEFITRLSAELTPDQMDKIKDGMTYGVVQVTYDAYLKLLPDLTDAQRQQIMSWLIEAREIAMDEGSADEKHKVFGKYKGRINNYLSAAGSNLKEAEKNLSK